MSVGRRRPPPRRCAASDRPWPSSSRLGTYGSTVDAEAPQGERHDREAGQPVRIEVAEDEDASAAVAGLGQPGQVRSPHRAARPDRGALPSGSANQCDRRPPRSRRRARRAGRPARAEMRPRSRPGCGFRAGTARLAKDPAEARFDHDVRMPREAAPRIYRPGARRAPQDAVRRTRGAAGRGQPAVPAVVPEMPVDERAATPRRSTSRSRDDPDRAAPG